MLTEYWLCIEWIVEYCRVLDCNLSLHHINLGAETKITEGDMGYNLGSIVMKLGVRSSDDFFVDNITLFVALLCACIVIGHLLEKNRWMNESIAALFVVSYCIYHYILQLRIGVNFVPIESGVLISGFVRWSCYPTNFWRKNLTCFSIQ